MSAVKGTSVAVVALCFACVASAEARGSTECHDVGFYSRSDGKSGYLVNWRTDRIEEVLSHGAMEGIFSRDPTALEPNMTDCSRGGISCISANSGQNHKIYAVKYGKKGDSYRVSHWLFTIMDTLSYNVGYNSSLLWVRFKDDNASGYSGNFLFDRSKGIVSISQEWANGDVSTDVLVSGAGLLSQNRCRGVK